jgi:hypothetical protein
MCGNQTDGAHYQHDKKDQTEELEGKGTQKHGEP